MKSILWFTCSICLMLSTHVYSNAAETDDVELVKNVMNDTVNGKFMAGGHYRNGVSCASCHGASLPVKGDTVANDKCLACHVSYEALAEKTKPKGAHGANPHKSHLDKIDCTVCHFGHQKSVVYCKDCHSKFNPKIPFGQ